MSEHELSMPSALYNTIINKSKANYRPTARQPTENRKNIRCTDEEERRKRDWMKAMYTVYTMSWASALLYDGCFIESMPFIDPTHWTTTGNCIFNIRWTRLDWGSFVTNKEIIENSQKTWEVSCTGPLNEAWLDRTVHQIFYNFFFISTHYVLFDMLLPGRWIGRLRFET